MDLLILFVSVSLNINEIILNKSPLAYFSNK